MKGSIVLSGSARLRVRSAALLGRTTVEVCLRRLVMGPRCPSWNLAAELGTEILKKQLLVAFEMRDVGEARSYLDSLAVDSGATSKISVSRATQDTFQGSWFIPKAGNPECVVLYLHGGGYAFYPRGFYDNLSALIALSANAKVFALDYRLTPEHRFPAQLEDATAAYKWLAGSGFLRSGLVVLGDSAGGNLALSLLLSLRDAKLPLPALGVCLSPATNFGLEALVTAKPELDWITPEMASRWANWFCSASERDNPLISPVNANLKGMPPLYVQAGGSGILFASIQAFVEEAKRQGAEISFDVWPEMNHDFQALGYDVPQSVEALRRIGEMIASHLPSSRHEATLS